MTKYLFGVTGLLAAACLAVATPATAQGTSAPRAPQTIDKVRLDEIAREAARQFAEARVDARQTRPTAPAPVPGTEVSLTLDDAVTRSLERNLDIAVERLNPRTFDFSIAALEATYRPTFISNLGLRNQATFSRSQTTGAGATGILKTETLTGNSGYSQNVKWGGGSFAMTFNNNRLEQSDAFAIRNPTLNTNFNAVYVQPLLRGFRIDTTRSQLLVTRLSQEVSEIGLRATIVTTLANVRNAYWDLVYAIQAADVAQRSLALATKLVEDNRSRVEVGTMAPIDVVQAQAEEAVRRQTVTQANATRRTAELALKRLIVSGTEDPLWTASLNPVDRPSFSAQPLDVEGAVRRALGNRTDLQQSRRQLESNDVSLRNLVDLRLPALDLTASYGMAGVGGTQFERQGLGGDVKRVIPSGYSDALRLLAEGTAPTWNVALSLSYPIGTSAAEANVARARLQQQQTVAQTKQLELQIATEVTNAALQVDANLERLQAAAVARELAEKRLEAEQSKFEVGMSTNFFVVQAQRDLADAQNAELRALLDHTRAQVDYERVQEAPAGRTTGGVTTITGVGGATGAARAAGAAGQGGGGFQGGQGGQGAGTGGPGGGGGGS
jgi:outer membrane protein TolC